MWYIHKCADKRHAVYSKIYILKGMKSLKAPLLGKQEHHVLMLGAMICEQAQHVQEEIVEEGESSGAKPFAGSRMAWKFF